jgi:lipopolysaccharide transport system ATP-binding protein
MIEELSPSPAPSAPEAGAWRLEPGVCSQSEPAITLDNVSKRYWLTGASYRLLRDDLAQMAGGFAAALGSRLSALGKRRARPRPSFAGCPEPRAESRDLPEGEEFWALRDVSLTVQPGEALGVIGPNGVGKSTILKLIAGIVHPTTGRISLRGRVGALIEVGAGIHPELTGRENVFLYGSLMGLPRLEIARKFDSIVAFAELERFIDQPVKRYSTGMQMRLGFAVAAHLDPEILLVDEVLAVGDAAFQQKCMARMRAIRAAGATVVYVSHALETVVSICDRGLFLSDGRVAFLGPVAEAAHAYMERLNQGRLKAPEIHLEVEGLDHGRVTHAAKLGAVTLLNAQGEETRVLEVGEEATFRVEIAFQEDLTAPVVGFILRNSGGVEVYNTNTQWMKRPLGRFQAGQRVVLEYRQRLPLVQGQYILNTGIAYGDLRAFCDWREEALSFFVKDSSGAQGVANLQTRVFIDGREVEEESL